MDEDSDSSTIKNSASVPDLKFPALAIDVNSSLREYTSLTKDSIHENDDKVETQETTNQVNGDKSTEMSDQDENSQNSNGNRRLGTMKPPGLILNLDKEYNPTPSSSTTPSASPFPFRRSGPATGSTDSAPSTPTRKFITTPVTDLGSNPFIFRKMDGKNKPGAGNGDLKKAKKQLTKSPSFPLHPSTAFLKQTSLDFHAEPPINRNIKNICNSSPVGEKMTRKASTMSVDSAMGVWTNESTGEPIWQKKLSQLFIPPSMEELEKCTKKAPDELKPNIVTSSPSKLKIKLQRTSSRDYPVRKRSGPSCSSNDEVLEKLIEDDGTSSEHAGRSHHTGNRLTSITNKRPRRNM